MANKIMLRVLFTICVITCFASCGITHTTLHGRRSISPNEYGLSMAKTDIERFYVLERTHKAAVANSTNVSYYGIESIDIEIPSNASSIPIGENTDFCGVTINVRNNTKDIRLFSAVAPRKSVQLSGSQIDHGNFSGVQELSRGRKLLIIEDEKPWGDKRNGYDYAHIRKDILLVMKGKSVNEPVMPYDNSYSNPKCLYIELNGEPFVFENLTVNRTPDCKFKTFILYVDGYDDVRLENVSVNTPDNDLLGDYVIRIHNCTNVSIKNVTIQGTYSSEEHSGYGISLNNVWDFKANHLYGRGKWGVFGTNNVNKATLVDCDINRFDIHCYGKDCFFKRVNFVDRDNQLSSVYGSVVFDECTFSNFTPLMSRSSYNAFVGYELFFNNCIFNVTPKKKSLLSMGVLNNKINSRPELKEKCWPNIHINNLTVNMTDGARDFFLLYNRIEGESLPVIHYIKSIEINGLTIFAEEGKPLKSIVLGTKDVETVNEIEIILNGINVYDKAADGRRRSISAKRVPMSISLPVEEKSIRFNNLNGVEFKSY